MAGCRDWRVLLFCGLCGSPYSQRAISATAEKQCLILFLSLHFGFSRHMNRIRPGTKS